MKRYTKNLVILFSVLCLSGCYEPYLQEPYYHHKANDEYPIRYKDNAFTGYPTMLGDLCGCVLVLPFSPAYLVMKDNYKNDEEATQNLKSVFGAVPRVCGYVVGSPFRLAKYLFYDKWIYP